MMKLSICMSLLLLLLAGCTAIPKDTASQDSEVDPASVEPTKLVEEPAPEPAIDRPNIPLTEDIMFKVLLAEIAGQRGKLDVAVQNYLELALETQDPLVIERATRIAVFARDDEAAYEAASLWTQVDPMNSDAHQVLTVMSLRNGNIDDALKHLEILLQSSEGNMDQKVWMIANFLGREEDPDAVLNLMERFMANHMDDAEALFAYAHVTARMGDTKKSTELLERVIELKPDNESAILTYIAMLQKNGDNEAAIAWLETKLNDKKDDFNLRLAYARLLADTKRYEDARVQFEILTNQAPKNADIIYALGLLYLQTDDLDKAEHYFVRLRDLKKQIFDANYYLGRIAEERDEFDKASDLYQGVHGGQNYFDAQIRLSLLLAQKGQIDKALENIRAIEKPEGIDRVILIQAEGEILTDSKRYAEAMAVFDKAIAQEPHPDLYYSRAMLAEKMGRIDILEADLKTILSRDPENTTALNALGYTLADRTDRYDEALNYIEKAYALSPKDFYILDSMGWIMYRLGRLDEAADYLRQALALRNDPEIAAHLGEVLWVMGDKKAAREVWETALKQTPEDDRLLKVIERFKQ